MLQRKRGINKMRYSRRLIGWTPYAAGLLAIILSAGCSQRPKEILSEKEMIDLMADLQLADAYSNSRVSSSEEDATGNRYDLARSVMAAHGVTPEQLDTTLGWYGKNLDEYVELYEKIDKELHKRRRKLMKSSDQSTSSANTFDLWQYSKNGVVSQLSSTDGWILSIDNPELEKGDKLVWSMRLAEKVDIAGNLGVEYSDGSGESSTINRTRNNNIEISLQTDTSKTVSRVYGSLRITQANVLPLFSDSIKLERLPFDSLEYKNSRSQKRFAAPRHIERKVEKKDTVSKVTVVDSINSGDKAVMLESKEIKEKETLTKPEVPKKRLPKEGRVVVDSKNGKN